MKSCLVFISILVTTSCAVQFDSRIVNGKDAAPNRFPFMALIKGLLKTNPEYSICAGILISHQWIVSAASCIFYFHKIYIYLGDVIAFKGISYEVQRNDIIIHEEFSFQPLRNDICVIQIPFTEYTAAINLIELPYSYENDSFLGKQGIALGWGYTRTEGPYSNHLKYLTLRVTANRICEEHGASVFDTNICVATNILRSPCKGDTGAPLVYFSRNGPIAIGIISYITNTECELGYPVVFTRLSKYLFWLVTKADISTARLQNKKSKFDKFN